MARYTVWANGVDMGTFEAESEIDAVDAYARVAGYTDFADLADTVGTSIESGLAEIVVEVLS